MLMGIKEIKEILPHRHPFLLVDCIEELTPGVRAVGYKNLTYDEAFFAGHFPDEPVMPGVLMVEALAQTGAVAVPGDRLRLECEIIKSKGPVGIGKATATVDGETAVVAELTFSIG